MDLRFGRVLGRALVVGLAAIGYASASEAQQFEVPETVRANPDGTFFFTIVFTAGPEGNKIGGYQIYNVANTDLTTHYLECRCMCPAIPPGEQEVLRIPLSGFARLIDPTREGRVFVGGGACEAIGFSSTIRILPHSYIEPIAVSLDIRPGSDSNPIHPMGRGILPVAILGADDFDVLDVDVTTLTFGPAAATPVHDLSDPDVYADHLWDVNRDGWTDLVTHYSIAEAGISIGDTEACLTGQLSNGDSFEGCDRVSPVTRRGAQRSAR